MSLLKHKPKRRQRKDTLVARPHHPDCDDAIRLMGERFEKYREMFAKAVDDDDSPPSGAGTDD